MRLPVVWVFTHDSVALGEDGPTHQPIEHFAALRAIPGLTVIRPADANETAEAWRFAIDAQDGPVCLLLTRQEVPVLDPSLVAGQVARGAYVVSDGGAPDAVIVACGQKRSNDMAWSEKVIDLAGGNFDVLGVHNYEYEDLGRISLATATEVSDNTVYAQLTQLVGPNAIARLPGFPGSETKRSRNAPVRPSYLRITPSSPLPT